MEAEVCFKGQKRARRQEGLRASGEKKQRFWQRREKQIALWGARSLDTFGAGAGQAPSLWSWWDESLLLLKSSAPQPGAPTEGHELLGPHG